jgi:hypothetical protein
MGFTRFFFHGRCPSLSIFCDQRNHLTKCFLEMFTQDVLMICSANHQYKVNSTVSSSGLTGEWEMSSHQLITLTLSFWPFMPMPHFSWPILPGESGAWFATQGWKSGLPISLAAVWGRWGMVGLFIFPVFGHSRVIPYEKFSVLPSCPFLWLETAGFGDLFCAHWSSGLPESLAPSWVYEKRRDLTAVSFSGSQSP